MLLPFVTIPKNTACLSSLYYISIFFMVQPLSLLVLNVGAGPNPSRRQDGKRVGASLKALRTQC